MLLIFQLNILKIVPVRYSSKPLTKLLGIPKPMSVVKPPPHKPYHVPSKCKLFIHYILYTYIK